jgi:trehalose 6-phosphate synthase
MDEPNKNSKEPLIIIVSNRGPYSFSRNEDGSFETQRGSGGLVTALGALAEKHEVLWVASAMSKADHEWAEEHQGQAVNVDDIYLRLITPRKRQYEQYYNVISNPLLWFIQHELWNIPRTPSITAETWRAWRRGYTAVNRQFAHAVADSIPDTDRPVIVLPQDYHLYLLPAFLRELVGDNVQIQPFVHIPWPGIDAWRILPGKMRDEILTSMLQADRVGFQTTKDAFNFVQNCRFYLPEVHSRGTRDTLFHGDKTTKAQAYPISVDVKRTEGLVEEAQTKLLKSQLINIIGDQRLILRVDRIEPSKNILRGLEAFATLLESYPEYRGKVKMLALLVPSRLEVDEYQDYLRDIMAQSGLINAQYSDPFWEPIRVIVGDHYHRAIAAMQLYDVLLVNPIADGMNLVAKEGVLVNEKNGCLILSEHAGAFYELHEDALIVSPFDVYGTSEAIHEALTMSSTERERRAEGLRTVVQNAGVQHWFDDQVRDALTAFASQDSSASTSSTPEANKSALRATEGGVPSSTTPTP